MAGATRTEGGATICRYCNAVLTFNFMARPNDECDCERARAERDASSSAPSDNAPTGAPATPAPASSLARES